MAIVNGAVLLAPPIALFTVAQSVPLRRALALAGLTLLALMTATGAASPFGSPTGGGFYLIPAPVAAALFGGIALRNRRAYVTSIEARAEEETRRRIDEERLRIARELHDIVAHTMATINVQAGVAAHVLADNPAAVGPALETIRQSSKDGLRELRAILNVLRQADEGEPTQPAPGLLQLEALITGACNAGLPVVLRQDGSPRQLPAATDLAAYRIVQESLTNVIKHAGPGATATVRLSYGDAAVRIEVTDTGVGPGPGLLAGGGQGIVGGHGIIGMRERAAAVAGTLVTGRARAAVTRSSRRCHATCRRPNAAQADDATCMQRDGLAWPGDTSPRCCAQRCRGCRCQAWRRASRSSGAAVMIRVLLADDQALIRAGFRVLLENAEGMAVVGEANNGAEAVDLARQLRADVVLMDIRMPGVDGLEATRRIAADDNLAGVKVIILTTFESDEYVYQAIRAGASGFLVKDAEPAELIQAIRVVAAGDALLAPRVTRRLITDLASRPERPQLDGRQLAALTDREREVLSLVAAGLSNDEIARQLFVSPLTAKTHVSRILTKLDARDRAQLVVLAYESGLVMPGSSGQSS